MAKKSAATKDQPEGKAKKGKGAAAKAVAKKPGASASAKKLSGKDYAREMKKLHVELVKLQEWVKLKGLKVCIVFEGRDGAGKGGTIKAITERTSPRVFRVIALPAPTEREKTQMYAQRYLPHLPAAGEVVIFDRSWYNRAGVERVMGFCSKEEAQGFLQMVPLFEKLMIKSGIILLKYWLEVSPEEQERRLRGAHRRRPQDLEAVAHGPEVLRSLGRLHQGARRDVRRHGQRLGAVVGRALRGQAARAPERDQPPAQACSLQGDPGARRSSCRSARSASTRRPTIRSSSSTKSTELPPPSRPPLHLTWVKT